jgi:hypothetical protein
MKIRLLVALVGLAICFALPTSGQQKYADPPIVQQSDLLGNAKAIGEFGDFIGIRQERRRRSGSALYGGRAFCGTRRNV